MKKNQVNWYYVIGALLLGLIIPDAYNPVAIVLSKFKKSDAK